MLRAKERKGSVDAPSDVRGGGVFEKWISRTVGHWAGGAPLILLSSALSPAS